jgi:ketosteroid isomerase-like protein
VESDQGVRALVARSCDAVARGDVDAWSACWRDDGTWVLPGVGTMVGRAALRDAFASWSADFDLCVQEVLSGWVDRDGDHASARWYLRETQRSSDGGHELLGCYDDTVVHDEHGWRFAHRRFWVLYRGSRDLSGQVFRRPPPASR